MRDFKKKKPKIRSYEQVIELIFSVLKYQILRSEHFFMQFKYTLVVKFTS